MTTRSVEVSLAPEDAWVRALAAARRLGKVESVSETARYLVFRARYGLNPVRLRVSILSSASPGAALIEISGRGQDVWGVASRKVIDRFVSAI